MRVQNEMRKVINNLIGLYRKPDLIRIELARDIGLSKLEREERTRAMRTNERKRDAAKKDLKTNGIADPSKDYVDKWVLWQECQKKCPYTGDSIGFDDLFRSGRFEIEHIWPRSVSFDDGLRNETLCRRDVNIAKGNRIPFEYFRNRPQEWAQVKDRLDTLVREKSMPRGKAKRFVAESIKDDFAERQIVDTGYAARQALAMLKRLWPDLGATGPVTVRAVSGRVTAQLRKLWGLNHILADDGEKTRADHRHHAIDALAVACVRAGYTIKLSRYFELEDLHRKGLAPKPNQAECPPPWSSIREDAKVAIQEVVVSHRVRKKVSGPLHKETVYGGAAREETMRGTTYRFFVRRKALEALTRNEIDNIVDERIRNIVVEWVASHGGDPKKAFATFPRVSDGGPFIRKARLNVKQQLHLMAPVSTGYADLGLKNPLIFENMWKINSLRGYEISVN